MNFQKKGLLTAILIAFVSVLAQAQITNDTTQFLYGPTTTRTFNEKNFFRGNYEEVPVDTAFNNSYSSLHWFGDTTFQQTLGNMGLATKPLTYQLQPQIGTRPGRNAFDFYAYHPDEITYFNTRSPYTKLYYVQGTLGEAVFESDFSRNIKKWWNAGFSYRRVVGNKQFGASTRKDGQVDGNAFKFFTHLQSTNNRYHLFANYSLLNQKWVESGGIKPRIGDTQDSLFNFLTEDIYLRHATARDMRHAFHISQTFGLFGDHLKLFHELEQRRQFDRYDDLQLDITNNSQNFLVFYPDKINYDSVQTHDNTTYTELQNTFGITGNQQHYYYKAYLRYRNATWEIKKPGTNIHNVDLPFNQTFNQVFAGGELEGRINNRFWGRFQANYKLTDEYFTQAELKFLYLKFTQTRVSAAPTLMQQTYFGNSYNWNNSFKNTVTDRSALQIQFERWKNYVRLELATTSIGHYIAFNQEEQPQQFSGTQRLNTATLSHSLAWGKFHWENLIIYTNSADAPEIRIPDWVINTRAYFQGYLFKKALFGQAGVESTFRSDYYGDAYSPALQQFYLQDNFILERYPVIDVFAAADIKSMNIFLKVAHVNDRLTGLGYFATPYYPGMRLSVVFGVKWMFFD